MPLLRKSTTRTIAYRRVFGGNTETITLYKRGDDQQQGTVVTYKLFNCRRSLVTKSGETIQGDMSSQHRTVWHIPRSELDRVGIAYLNPIDLIREKNGDIWQPESTTVITVKLFDNEIDLSCLRLDQNP